MDTLQQPITISPKIDVFVKLNEVTQLVQKLTAFLATELNNDILLYDKAKLEDDGYRISSDDLRKKYGV